MNKQSTLHFPNHMLRDSFTNVVTPFLGKRALLFQSILAPGVLVCIIFVVRLHILKLIVLKGINLAKSVAVKGCTTAEDTMALAINAPRETVAVANKMIASSVEKSVQAFLDSVSVLATVVENLAIFALEMTIGTYACLTVSLVNIAANEAINATESVIKFSNSTVQSIANDLDDGLGKLTKLINGAVGLIQDVTQFVTGGSSDLKNVNLTVESLRHIAIPGSINSRLEDVRTKIPNYNETKTAVENIIREPFGLITEQLGQVSLNQLSKMTPIQLPSLKSTQGAVCDLSELDHKFDKLYSVVNKAIIVMTILCVLAAIALMAWDSYRASSHFNRLEIAASRTGAFLGSKGEKQQLQEKADNINVINYASDSYIARKILAFLESRVPPGPRRELWTWYVRFLFHEHLTRLFIVGIAIIVLGTLELIVYRILKAGEGEIRKLSQVVVENVENVVNAQYREWTSSTNSEISRVENDVNNNALGWVREGSAGLNTSLSTFMTKINDEVNHVFNNTPLQKPIAAVVQCVIGNKVERVEDGLVWMHDHANITLPRVPESLFSLNGTNSSLPFTNSTLSKRSHTGVSVKSLGSEAAQAFEYMMAIIRQQIKSQAIIGGCFIGVWLLIAVGSLAYILHQMRNHKDVLGPDSPDSPPPLQVPLPSFAPSRQSSQPQTGPVPPKRQTLLQRMSNIFMGPSRKPVLQENIQIPHYVNYIAHDMDSPRTPLRASFH